MSDDLLNALRTHSILNGQSGGSSHDDLADSFKRGSSHHDALSDALGRNPYALETRPSDYHPAREPRTESDYSSLPIQPDRVDNAWDYMKNAFHDVWGSKEHGVIGKSLETLSIPGEAVANSMARATHSPLAKDHDTVGQWYNILANTGPAPSGKQDASYYSRLAGAWGATLLSDPLQYIGVGPTSHAEEALDALKMARMAPVTAGEAAVKAKPLAELVHAPNLDMESIRNVAAPSLIQKRLGETIQGLQDTIKDAHPSSHEYQRATPMIQNLSQMHQYLSPGGEHLAPEVGKPSYKQLLEGLRAKSDNPFWLQGNDEFTSTPWGIKNRHIPDIGKVPREVDPEAPYKAASQFLDESGQPNLMQLARHQVLKERQIEHGLPSLRLAGAKTPIPSPFPAVGGVVNRALGRYNQQTGLSGTTGAMGQTLEEAAKTGQYPIQPGSGRAFSDAVGTLMPKDYVKRMTGGTEDHTQVPVHRAYDYLHSLQQGRAVEGAGQTANLPSHGLLYEPGPLHKWVENFVQHFDIPDRPRAAKAAVDMYQGLADGAHLNPELRMRNSVEQLRAGADTLRRYTGSNEFASQHFNPQSALPKVEGMSFPEQAKKNFADSMTELFNGDNGHVQKLLAVAQRPVTPGANPQEAAGQYVDAMQQLYDFFTGTATQTPHGLVPGFKTLDQKLNGAMTAHYDLIHSNTPWDVQQSLAKDAVDHQKEGRQARTVLQTLGGSVDQMLRGPRANGLEMLGKSPMETLDKAITTYGHSADAESKIGGDFIQRLAQSHGLQDITGGPTAAQQLTDQVRQVFHTQLDQMVTDGRHTLDTALKAKNFLQDLSPDKLYKATQLMKQARVHSEGMLDPVEHMRRMGVEKLATWLGGLNEMESHITNRMRLPFESSWNAMHWTHEPNALGRLFNRTMEPAMNAVLRHSGWPQRLVETFNEWNGSHAISKHDTERKSLGEWYATHFDKAVGETLGRKATPQELHQLDEAITRVEEYKGGILPSEVKDRYLSALAHGMGLGQLDPSQLREGLPKLLAQADEGLRNGTLDPQKVAWVKRTLRIDQIAREEWAKGNQFLQTLYGSPEKAQQAVDHVLNAYETHITDPMMAKEVASGQAVVRRGRYIPRSNLGSWSDKRELQETLKRMRDDGLHPAEYGAPVSERQPTVSSSGSYENRRAYPSAAHHAYDIEEANNYRKHLPLRQDGPKPPLQVAVDHSLASRTATRYHEHLRAMANLKLIHQLADILPDHVLFFLPPRGGANAVRGMNRYANLEEMATKQGFQDVGTLVPQLAGYKVSPTMHKYLASYVRDVEDPSGVEEVSNLVGRPLSAIMRYWKAVNTHFSGVHIKNTMANALVAGGPQTWKRAAEIVGEASKKYAQNRGETRWFSSMLPLARSMEDHPLYLKGVKHGLFRSGSEYELPVQDLIRLRMNPRGLGGTMLSWAKDRTGPFNTVTFDVVDRALRMALMEQGMRTGMTEARAAEVANHKMVDYSMRQFTPSARKALYSTMPFPAWTLGNLFLHGPQAVQNPFWYSILAHAAQQVNDHEDGVKYPTNPELVAGSIAMPYTLPGSNNQAWYNPQFPWQSPLKMQRQVLDEVLTGHPLVGGKIAGKYLTNRLFEFPFGLKSAFDMARGGPQAEEKKSLAETLIGKKGSPNTGMTGEVLWGPNATGLPAFFRDWVESGQASPAQQWPQVRLPLPGADWRSFLESQVGGVQGVTPQGKMQY